MFKIKSIILLGLFFFSFLLSDEIYLKNNQIIKDVRFLKNKSSKNIIHYKKKFTFKERYSSKTYEIDCSKVKKIVNDNGEKIPFECSLLEQIKDRIIPPKDPDQPNKDNHPILIILISCVFAGTFVLLPIYKFIYKKYRDDNKPKKKPKNKKQNIKKNKSTQSSKAFDKLFETKKKDDIAKLIGKRNRFKDAEKLKKKKDAEKLKKKKDAEKLKKKKDAEKLKKKKDAEKLKKKKDAEKKKKDAEKKKKKKDAEKLKKKKDAEKLKKKKDAEKLKKKDAEKKKKKKDAEKKKKDAEKKKKKKKKITQKSVKIIANKKNKAEAILKDYFDDFNGQI